MKKIFLLLLIFLVACSSQGPAAQVAVLTSTSTIQPSLSATLTVVPSVTSTTLPTITPTDTPIPCDPHTVDYCITDGHFLFERPVQPPHYDSVDPTYRFASTANGTRDPHHGVEIGKDAGTPIQAAGEGVVLFAGPDDKAQFSPWTNFYGNMIVIQHADDVFTLYGHLSKIDVQAGEKVTAGEQIGEMGHSGAATGSHLHFEVRRGKAEDYSASVNPELWLMPKPDCGALMISLVDADGKFERGQFTIQQFSAANEPLLSYYLDTYDKSLLTSEENAGMTDLPAGRYRISLIQNGHLLERWVDVQSGKLTQVVIVDK